MALEANSPTNSRWFIGIIGLTHQTYVTWNWSQTSVAGTRTFQWVRGGFDGGGYAFRSFGEGRALVLEEIVQQPPQLDVTLLDGQIEVRWSTSHADSILESASVLGTTNWSAVTNDVFVVGEEFSVVLDATETSAFFRLRKIAP